MAQARNPAYRLAMDFPKTLADAMAESGMDQSELARRLKISPSAVNQWLAGTTQPTRKRLALAAEILGKPIRHFLESGSLEHGTYKENLKNNLSLPLHERSPTSVSIPDYAIRGKPGGNYLMPPLDEINEAVSITSWSMPSEMLVAHTLPDSQLAVFRVQGDSMKPEYLPCDRVLVDKTSKSASPSGVYVIWDGLGFTLRRLDIVIGSSPLRVRIAPSNPSYATYEQLLADLHIGGRVIGRWDWQ